MAFSADVSQARENGMIIQIAEGKVLPTEHASSCRGVFQSWRRCKYFSKPTRAEGVYHPRPALDEMLKGFHTCIIGM